jgi:hypothetical protein
MAESELTRITRLNTRLLSLLAALDDDIIGRETRKAIEKIKLVSADARLDVRDWEFSDSREEMEQNAKTAVKRIDELRALILKASEYGIFGAVDVADITSRLDEVADSLR